MSKINQLRNEDDDDQSITRLEDLSNEVLYEILDYLEGCDLYQTFSRLNYRFDQLLNCSSLRLKIQFDSTSPQLFKHFYKQLRRLNKHQIFSFYFYSKAHSNRFFSSFTFRSSLIRLESVVIELTDSFILMSILKEFLSLPRLFSLDIRVCDDFNDLNDIFRVIFALPVLQFIRFTLSGNAKSITLPMATNEQRNCIKDLGIDASCTFKELASLISYTPELCRLRFINRDYDDPISGLILPMILPNLSNLCITVYNLTFDRFQLFMKNMPCILRALYLRTSSRDTNFLDATRWERLILEDLSQLKKLNFHYHECVYEGDEPTIHMGKLNQFTSSFWIERRWIFDAEINSEEITYVIQPYKTRWYEYGQPVWIPSSSQLARSARLTFTNTSTAAAADDDDENESFFLEINSILTVTDISHLEIEKESILINTLIDIIDCLPKLVTLKICSLLLSKLSSSDAEEQEDSFAFISNTNQIRKVYLKKTNTIEDAYVFIKLCPRMNYLQVDDLNTIDAKVFLSSILKHIINVGHDHLCSLSIHVPTGDDQMIEQLAKMIDSEKLLVDYTIQRVAEHIYLQWK